jgi:hypothetical protein
VRCIKCGALDQQSQRSMPPNTKQTRNEGIRCSQYPSDHRTVFRGTALGLHPAARGQSALPYDRRAAGAALEEGPQRQPQAVLFSLSYSF